MKKLYVNLAENSYNILFSDSFEALPNALTEINAPKKLLIVTDTNVEKLYADEVCRLLKNSGFDCRIYAFEAGEQNKNMAAIEGICSACMDHGMDRKSMIIALGGGVTGDMAGFAAAIYMRGIRFVQIPTTLLSQSDSSVGGKTGIDFGGAKNILGAFHQPALVYINVNTLKSLPKREFSSGMGEVIKHGIIQDKSFFDFISNNAKKIKELDSETMILMSERNCAIKAHIVEEDEKENGKRALLNFGHTIGHAIEAASDFKLTHGECVGLGFRAASYIALGRGMISREELLNTENLMKLYDLSLSTEIKDKQEISELMKKDKKNQNGALKFILPKGIGTAVAVTDVTEAEIDEALEYITSK